MVQPSKKDLERLVTAYDQAIKDYETFYRQQQIYHRQRFQFYPYSHSSYASPGYYEQELADKYGPVFAEYEENIQAIEQAQADFNAALPFIQRLGEKEREEYIKEWKEYLQSFLELSQQLTDYIEKSIELITPKSL